jgi:hypothetical protein
MKAMKTLISAIQSSTLEKSVLSRTVNVRSRMVWHEPNTLSHKIHQKTQNWPFAKAFGLKKLLGIGHI